MLAIKWPTFEERTHKFGSHILYIYIPSNVLRYSNPDSAQHLPNYHKLPVKLTPVSRLTMSIEPFPSKTMVMGLMSFTHPGYEWQTQKETVHHPTGVLITQHYKQNQIYVVLHGSYVVERQLWTTFVIKSCNTTLRRLTYYISKQWNYITLLVILIQM